VICPFRSGIINKENVFLPYWDIWTILEQLTSINNILGLLARRMTKLLEFGTGNRGFLLRF